MAAFAPIPCVGPQGRETLCMDWSKDEAAPLLAVSCKGSEIQLFNDVGELQTPGVGIKRPCDAELVAWNPKQ